MDKRTIREFRSRAQDLAATVHVGKEGITLSLADELKNQLKSKNLVKVRLLQSFEGDRQDAGKSLAEASDSVVVEVRGRTVVLARE